MNAKPKLAVALEGICVNVVDTGVVENYSQSRALFSPPGGDPVVDLQPKEGFLWWLLRASALFDITIYSTEGRQPGRFGVSLIASFMRWQEKRGRADENFPENVSFASGMPAGDYAVHIHRGGYRFEGDWQALNPELIYRRLPREETKDDYRATEGAEDAARAPYKPRGPAPRWLRLLGFRGSWEGWGGDTTGMRMAWGELSIGGEPKLGLQLGRYDGCPHLNIAVPGLQVFINLPAWRWLMRLTDGPNGMERATYGSTIYFGKEWGRGTIILHWSSKTKVLGPFYGVGHKRGDARRFVLLADGSWHEKRYGLGEPAEEPPAEWAARYPYATVTESGRVQETMATVTRERVDRIFRLFRWKIRSTVEHVISVQFDDEMGDRRGSWKGGTTGMSFTMKAGETPRDALRRMQLETKFR